MSTQGANEKTHAGDVSKTVEIDRMIDEIGARARDLASAQDGNLGVHRDVSKSASDLLVGRQMTKTRGDERKATTNTRY